jgi:nucleoside-diphosphate-sugar epimerase
MRILVTGASGFIGGVLCPQLRERGHDVSALVRRPGSEPPDTRPLAGDLSDGPALARLLESERPDCVIHLAAEIASQRDARKIEEVNINGTRRLVDACKALAGADPGAGPRIVLASTVVTGNAHGALLTEDAPLPVETPYGRSKQEGERIVRASASCFTRDCPPWWYGLRTCTARAAGMPMSCSRACASPGASR